MLKSSSHASFLILLYGLASAQSTTRPPYFANAVIRHSDSKVVIQANYPTPLFQATVGVRRYYGWQVSFEVAPVFSRFDLVDDTSPKWRAAHPGAKGVTRPAGGLFTATLPEPLDSSVVAESDLLSKLIEEYNEGGNPGKYALRTDLDNQFAVVGTKVQNQTGDFEQITPILDVLITIPKATRTVDQTIESILGAVQTSTGQRVMNASFGSVSGVTRVTLGGDHVSARRLLQQTLAASGRPVIYDLLYDADVPTYLIAFSVATQEEDEGSAGRKLVPLDHLPNRN